MNYCKPNVFALCFLCACSSADKTTGFWQEMHAKTEINTGIQRTGKQVYDYKCYECHSRNTQGAPMPGDNYQWRQRYNKGMEVLLKHTIDGYNRGLMPARGGCRNCNENELQSAIVYMLKQSGISPEEKR